MMYEEVLATCLDIGGTCSEEERAVSCPVGRRGMRAWAVQTARSSTPNRATARLGVEARGLGGVLTAPGTRDERMCGAHMLAHNALRPSPFAPAGEKGGSDPDPESGEGCERAGALRLEEAPCGEEGPRWAAYHTCGVRGLRLRVWGRSRVSGVGVRG